MLVRAPHYAEPLHELLCSIGRFPWSSNLDFPIAHCAMSLCKDSKNATRLVMIFGTFECQALWVGVSPASGVFQGRIELTLRGALP